MMESPSGSKNPNSCTCAFEPFGFLRLMSLTLFSSMPSMKSNLSKSSLINCWAECSNCILWSWSTVIVRLSGGQPTCHDPVPALSACHWLATPFCLATSLNTASAIGDRHMLPRHTNRTLRMSLIVAGSTGKEMVGKYYCEKKLNAKRAKSVCVIQEEKSWASTRG